MIAIKLVSILLFFGFTIFFIYKNQKDHLLVFAFLVKIAAAILLGIIYKYYYQGGDTFVYYDESGVIARHVLTDPVKHAGFYFNHDPYEITGLTFYEQPRALFFSKILSVFHILTGGNYWLMAVILAMINFFCIKQMVDQINRKFSVAKFPASMSFYFLPTFVFWTSGLLKESLAIGAFCLLVAQALELSQPHAEIKVGKTLLIIISAVVFWNLKYFYAAVIIPILLATVAYERIKSPKYRILIPLMVLIIMILFFSTAHYNLGVRRVLSVVYENYLLSASQGNGDITYYHFDGSIVGFLINIPLAFFSGLFRPFLFEWSNPFQVVVALENFGIFALLIIVIWRVGFPKNIKNPWIIAAFLMILSLNIFIAFSTPNFGTLSRFKVAYWPFFVMLVISWSQSKNKSQVLGDLA